MPKPRAALALLAMAVAAAWVAVATAQSPLLVDEGGRVLTAPQVSAIYLGDYWQTQQGASEALHVDTFLQTWLAGPSVTDVLAQYRVGPGSFLGSDKVAGAAPIEFTDAQAQALVQQEITGRRVATSAQTVHIVYLPPGTVLTFQGLSSQSKLGGYHSSYRDPATGAPVVYAVIVYNDGVNGLDFGGRPQDNLTIITSRVVAGAVTDPDVGDVLRGAAPQGVLGWRDPVHGEVGDVAFTLSADPALGDVWVLQNAFAVVLLWSNKDGKLTAGSSAPAGTPDTPGPTATAVTTFSIAPATQEAVPGTTVTYTVSNPATAADAVALVLSELPENVTGSFAATQLAPGASTTLSIAVAQGATAGTTTTFTVTGTTLTTTETATATLSIVTALTPAPAPVTAADFSLSVTPTAREMTRGGDVVTYAITSQPSGAASPLIKLKVLHLRRGLRAYLSSRRITAGETATLTIVAHRTARRRAYELVLKGSSDQADQRIPLALVVK